jgi:hypothetical protein
MLTVTAALAPVLFVMVVSIKKYLKVFPTAVTLPEVPSHCAEAVGNAGKVVGAIVVAATVVGAAVVGAAVVGATVVGATVVGATVVGAAVVGATVVATVVAGAVV